MLNVKSRIGSVYYGWWVVLSGSLVMALMAGPYFHGSGTFIAALDKEFHWSRTILSGAFSLSRMEGSILGPLAGYLTDKLRPAVMVLIGFTIMALGYVVLSFVNTPVVFYVAIVIIAVGAGLGSFLPAMTCVAHWFIRRRSMAMALTMAGTSAGGLMVGLLALGIEHFGWRTISLAIAAITLICVWPLSRAFRRQPERSEVERAEAYPEERLESDGRGARVESADFTVRQALGTRAFWVLSLAHAAVNMSLAAIVVHSVPHLTDVGISIGLAGTVVTTYTAVSLVAQLVGGWLGDKANKKSLIAIFLVVQGAGVLMFAFTTTLWHAYVFAVLFGIGMGGRTPVLHALRADYFGHRSFASITGIYSIPLNIGMVIPPVAVGFLYDVRDTSRYGMLVMGILAVAGAVLVLFANRPMLPVSRQANGG